MDHVASNSDTLYFLLHCADSRCVQTPGHVGRVVCIIRVTHLTSTASTSDGPSFVSWTVADEALIVRWRDESTPRCGFFVSVEKATVYEQDGFLDFGAPDFLQAAGDTRSIVVHGLLPNATYRIAVRTLFCWLRFIEL